MGATASINYAASKKYKPSDPIEVKFDQVVKYDDGDEKPFRDNFQVATRKQPLSLLATAIRILERKPKEHHRPLNGHIPNNYAKQLRPRSAYVVLKKPIHFSSTHNSSNQNDNLVNQISQKHEKQLKTKQNLYMSLIHPSSVRNSKFGMTVPSRIRTPMDYHLPTKPSKENTLTRYSNTEGKRIRVNRKLYMDMIRPVMTSPQYLKLGATRSTPPLSLTQRAASRQSQLKHASFMPRPPNGAHYLRRLEPNSCFHQERHSGASQRGKYRLHREDYTQVGMYRPHKGEYSLVSTRPSTVRGNIHSSLNSSLTNSTSLSLQREVHLPHLTRTMKDEVTFNSSLNSRSRQIPPDHPDNITPLHFQKSLAYNSHCYEHKEPLSNPLSSMNM